MLSRALILKVSICCALENVLISSRNWPVRLTPGMLPASERAKKAKTRTVVIGRATYNVRRGKTVTVKVRIAKKYRTLLKTGKVRNVSLQTGKTKTTKKVVVQKAKKKAAGRK